MSGNTTAASSDRKIGGKTVEQWDEEWVEMEGGFGVAHNSLHYQIGLFRADLKSEPKVMGSATDFDGGGLFKRLQTFRSPIRQTGNNHKAANYIKDNMNDLTLWVITMGKGAGSDRIAKELCKIMRKRYGLKRGVIGAG